MTSTLIRNSTDSTFQIYRLMRQHQAEFSTIVEYLGSCRKKIFPFIQQDELPQDLINFQQVYVDDPLGCLICVKQQHKIVAVIGFRAYDQRFSHLNLPEKNVVEVVRLYVEPAYRRTGIASVLVEYIKTHAIAQNVQTLYLHTHPFLLGAVEFWQYHHFQMMTQDHHDPVWQTIHMQYQLI
ncbi:GNAT family N-acetyltransferase [Acinetobacter qingfengensis]|nr:GNAT family N-acetyltransferase [Acinetobacter qingfengensis]